MKKPFFGKFLITLWTMSLAIGSELTVQLTFFLMVPLYIINV